MTALLPVRPSHTWAGRTGACLAIASAVVHMAGIAGHGVVHSALVAVMALGCVYCAWHLWRRPTPSGWALTAIMNVGMIVVHQNVSMPGPHAGSHHSVPTLHTGSAMPYSNAALAIAAAEVAFATVVLFATTRSTSPRPLLPTPRNRLV